MKDWKEYIQQKWNEGLLPGIDCILFGDGTVIVGNCYSVHNRETNKRRWYWSPLCDTTIGSIEKYEPDIWTEIDIYHGSFDYKDQHIVFGDGAMGNEGFVASTNKNGILNWGIFFTFSNPIYEAEIQGEILICKSDNDIQVAIQLNDLTKIQITYQI